MENERTYYLAGGADLLKAKQFFAERSVAQAKMQELAKNYGAISCAVQSGMIGGLIFKNNEPPLGWLQKGWTTGREPFFLPRRTTNENKEICKHINSVRAPNIYKFHTLFSKESGVMKEGGGFSIRILYISWENIGDKTLLSVPFGSDYTPDGSTELKMSEYWALKEA